MYCCVYNEKTPDDGQRNCPKHVQLYSKNKFEKLVHLVGFIIRTSVTLLRATITDNTSRNHSYRPPFHIALHHS